MQMKMQYVLVNICLGPCINEKFVRLNLFNHVLALFHAKFTCNLAIRYLYLGGNYVKVVCEKV